MHTTSNMSQIMVDGAANAIGALLPYILIALVISILLSFFRKRPEFAGIGCLGILILGALVALGQFIKAHSTVFIVVGLLIALVLLIVVISCWDEIKEKVSTEVDNAQYRAETKRELNRQIAINREETQFQPYTDFVGKVGELNIAASIDVACHRAGKHYRILQNVYVPRGGGTSEIDVLLLHETGIYVIESKNLSGSIYGENRYSQWLRYKRNEEFPDRFPNPVRQNEGHIKALYHFLNIQTGRVPVYSYIVFGNKADIGHVESVSSAKILSLWSLENQIINSLDSLNPVIPSETIDRWHSMLQSCVNVSDAVKNAHKQRTTQRFQKLPFSFR